MFDTGATNRSAIIRFKDQGTTSGFINYHHQYDRMDFGSGSSTGIGMSLTSGGDLLVGTTSTSTATQGIKLRSDIDAIAAVADGQISGYFGRLNSDGDILNFRKNTTTVGNIGTSGDELYIGKGDTTLLFNESSDAVLPRGTNGAQRDGAIQLGSGSNRFSDLYLSGGVHLGGTGSANKLDDYEEGTWTPNLTDSSANSVSQSGQTGHYTKIGNMVYVIFGLTVSSTSGAGNGLQIRNLPFAVENVTHGSGEPSGGALTYATGLQSRDLGGGVILRANNATSYIEMKYTAGGAQNNVGATNLNCSDLASSGTYMTGYCHYRTS